MVQLKVENTTHKHKHLVRFNSKMVQLKAIQNNSPKLSKGFEFQNGSIKRIAADDALNTRIEFEFQNGSIKRIKGGLSLFLCGLFEFQNGSIKR